MFGNFSVAKMASSNPSWHDARRSQLFNAVRAKFLQPRVLSRRQFLVCKNDPVSFNRVFVPSINALYSRPVDVTTPIVGHQTIESLQLLDGFGIVNFVERLFGPSQHICQQFVSFLR